MDTDQPAPVAPPRPDALVGAKDEDFAPHTWEEAKKIIAADRLDLLDRWPSDARRYVDWSASIKSEYGSVTNFIIKERIKWKPASDRDRPVDSMFAYNSPVPFENEGDYRILRNDWPYRWDEGIVHICVWMKNKLPTEAETGKITQDGRDIVDRFVYKTFIEPLGSDGRDRVLWYKNWAALQSVSSLEHFHVLVRDIPEWRIHRWTGSDKTIHEVDER